jgi:hypothetical protein
VKNLDSNPIVQKENIGAMSDKMKKKQQVLHAAIDEIDKLMQKSGHINDFKDLSEQDNDKSIELHDRMLDIVELEKPEDLICADIPICEVEKVRNFFIWYERLDTE